MPEEDSANCLVPAHSKYTHKINDQAAATHKHPTEAQAEMVWTCVTQRRRGRPRTTWRDVIQRDLTLLDTGWSIEEAEVAAQDRTIWKIFTSRAASADNA